MIELLNVSKRYSRHQAPALDDLTLTVEKGEFVFIVGSSGSGKSTLLRLIIREEAPSRGHLEVAGFDLDRLPHKHVPRLRRQIGTVFQDFRLLPSKTVEENVAFALRVIGGTDRQIRHAVPEVLELVGLAGKEKRMPDELSGGEQQRVALARAVVNRPPLLLADEPTGNLDPATSLEIVSLLERIHAAGTTVVMATHDSSIVDALSKRVVELDRGVLIRDEERGRYVPRLNPEEVNRQQEALAVLPGPTASLYAQRRPSSQQREAEKSAAAAQASTETRSGEAKPAAALDPAASAAPSAPDLDEASPSAWNRSNVGPITVPPSTTWNDPRGPVAGRRPVPRPQVDPAPAATPAAAQPAATKPAVTKPAATKPAAKPASTRPAAPKPPVTPEASGEDAPSPWAVPPARRGRSSRPWGQS